MFNKKDSDTISKKEIKKKIKEYRELSREFYKEFIKGNRTDIALHYAGIRCDAKIEILEELLKEISGGI